LPNGTVGTGYNQTLTAAGTVTSWTIQSGNLPMGLSLSTSGVISGTPTATGTFNFTVKATNSTGSDTKALSIIINSSRSVTPPTPPDYGDYNCDLNSDGTLTITKYNGSETSVVIPSKINGKTVTAIGNNAFAYCKNITSITIPNTVTSIGSRAFGGCESLTSIIIPDGVKSIGDYAFGGCGELTKVTFKSKTPPAFGKKEVFNGCLELKNKGKIYVPYGAGTAYKAALSEYSAIIIEESNNSGSGGNNTGGDNGSGGTNDNGNNSELINPTTVTVSVTNDLKNIKGFDKISLPSNYLVLTSDKHGELDGVKTVKIPTGTLEKAGLDFTKVRLFYISDSGEITEEKDVIKLNDDGSITISFTHFSAYVLSLTAPKPKTDTPSGNTNDKGTTTNKTENNPNTGVVIPIAAAVLSGGVVAVVRKKKKSDKAE